MKTASEKLNQSKVKCVLMNEQRYKVKLTFNERVRVCSLSDTEVWWKVQTKEELEDLCLKSKIL